MSFCCLPFPTCSTEQTITRDEVLAGTPPEYLNNPNFVDQDTMYSPCYVNSCTSANLTYDCLTWGAGPTVAGCILNPKFALLTCLLSATFGAGAGCINRANRNRIPVVDYTSIFYRGMTAWSCRTLTLCRSISTSVPVATMTSGAFLCPEYIAGVGTIPLGLGLGFWVSDCVTGCLCPNSCGQANNVEQIPLLNNQPPIQEQPPFQQLAALQNQLQQAPVGENDATLEGEVQVDQEDA